MGALIDEWMPACDVGEYHEVFCRSSAHRTYEAMRSVDLAQSATVRWLFRMRGIGPFSGYIRTGMLATIKQEAEF